MAEQESNFPPVERPEGWSTVEVPGKDGQPGARFWVRATDGGVNDAYGEDTVNKPIGRTPFDDLRDEVEGDLI